MVITCLSRLLEDLSSVKILKKEAEATAKMKPYQWLVLAAVVASGIASCLEADPDDPDRCLVLNTTGTDPPNGPSVAPISSGPFLTTVEKVKLGSEIVGGTFSFLLVLWAIYYGLKRGERFENVLAGALPFFAQMREIWRPHPRPQADLIDL